VNLDPAVETPVQTFYPGPLGDPLGMRDGLTPLSGVPSHGLTPGESDLTGLDLDATEWTVDLDPGRSAFGDCIRVVDGPGEESLAPGLPPFGWSSQPLLGGHLMTAARLAGELRILFAEKDEEGLLPFEIQVPAPLRGGDGVLAAPGGYALPAGGNVVEGAGPPSRGRLDPASGRVYDLHFNCRFDNSAIRELLAHNPELEAPPLLFPGLPHSGHALGWFELGDDGPSLGPGSAEDPLKMPPANGDGPLLARNSSLHPFLFLHGRARRGGERRATRPDRMPSGPTAISKQLSRRENSRFELVCLPLQTCFGDDFELSTEALGGGARAQSPLFGSLHVQLGPIADGLAPFALCLAPPADAYGSKFEALLRLLPPGTMPGLVGMRGDLAFPKDAYEQRNLSLNSDPYKLSIGVVDVASGNVSGAVLRKFLFQDLMMQLLLTEPRTPTDSFSYLTSGRFELRDGKLALDLDGALFIPYPSGYRFPLPDGGTTVAEEGSHLVPFVHLTAVEREAFEPLPTGTQIAFEGDRHLRGRMAQKVRLELRGNDDGDTAATLRFDDLALNGRGERPRHLRLGGTELVTGELLIDGPEPSVCTYHLTTDGDEAHFQISAVDEVWDCWYAGSMR
jgi:cold shock CspA family protein